MIRFLFLFIPFVTLSLPLHAAEDPPEAALPLSYSAEEIAPAFERDLRPIVNSALIFVQMYPPKGYERNLFRWSGDRTILNGKTVSLVMAKSTSKTFAPILGEWGTYGLDAFTLAPINVPDKTMPIFLVVLVDKIFYDEHGKEREDGFARLVLALAHEIYGNVQHFLNMDLTNPVKQTVAMRIAQEKKAYEASLLFLGGMFEDAKFKTVPEGIRRGLYKQWPKEVRAYRSWFKARPSESPDPTCEKLLKSIFVREQ